MKELPKYFVIKRDADNPLWKKYIDWLYNEYKQRWAGNNWHYYGYDGSSVYRGTDCFNELSEFQNNPTLITLEEWNECVNGVKQEEPQGYFTYQNWTL